MGLRAGRGGELEKKEGDCGWGRRGGEGSIWSIREVTDAGPSGHLSWNLTQDPSPVLSLSPWALHSSVYLCPPIPRARRLARGVCERDHTGQRWKVDSQTESREPATCGQQRSPAEGGVGLSL